MIRHASLLSHLSMRVDLIHFHSSRAGLFRLAFFLRGRPSIIEFSPHGWGWLAAPRIAKGPYALVERLLSRVTDHFHLLGENEAYEARRHLKIPESRYSIVRNGVDTGVFYPRQEEGAGVRAGIEILCVGRLCEQKGQDLLIRAVAEILSGEAPHVLLTVIGSGPAEHELRTLARDLGVDAQFLGQRTELARYYNSADIVVLPSRWEGVPLVALEAIACGSAVLLTEPAADPSLRNWVMTCDPTVAGLGAALTQLIRNPDTRNELRRRASDARHAVGQGAALAQHVELCRALVGESKT